MNKMLAVDMDGTCLNDKNIISEENLKALRVASHKSIIVVPTTGRALSCLPHQLKGESFYHYVISSNGALLTDIDNNCKLFRALLANEMVISLLEAVEDLKLGISIHANDELILQGKLLAAMGRISYGVDAKQALVVKDVCEYLKVKKCDVEEVQLFFFSDKTRDSLKEILNKYKNIEYAFSDKYVELYSRNANKGNALAALAKKLNIDLKDIACIGDSENDLSMFDVAGFKMAMGNAIDELKNKADVCLNNNNENGVADGINNHLIKEKNND